MTVKYYRPNSNLSANESQNDFVLWAFAYYNKIENDELVYYRPYFNYLYPPARINPCRQYAAIEELYAVGRYVFQVLTCDYLEFKNALLCRQGVFPGYYDYIHRGNTTSPWYEKRGVHYREKLPKGKKERKEVSETEYHKILWREQKGFSRDYRRRSRGHASGRKGHAKNISNRTLRQQKRSLINKEDWDSFHRFTPKDIFDPWFWD